MEIPLRRVCDFSAGAAVYRLRRLLLGYIFCDLMYTKPVFEKTGENLGLWLVTLERHLFWILSVHRHKSGGQHVRLSAGAVGAVSPDRCGAHAGCAAFGALAVFFEVRTLLAGTRKLPGRIFCLPAIREKSLGRVCLYG